MATDANPSKHRLLAALRREATDTTPIWIMRQAGRYLPEYRAVRERAGSFLVMAKTPEIACEVTLQPLRRFDLDAAIVFSDILTIPDAMGLGLSFVPGAGPAFERPVASRADIDRLAVPDMAGELRYVMDAVALSKRELGGRAPLIGFAGSPWTIACYMIEGKGGSDFARARALGFDDPASLHALLDVMARAIGEYLAAQAAAGADVLMVFDSWGGYLGPDAYREFSLRYLERIVALLKARPETADVPLILFSKGANGHLGALAATGAAALGVDWTIDLADARRATGGRVALQGNLDPAALRAAPDALRREVRRVLDSFGDGPGHVFNLGHGITPDIDPERVAALVDAVHELGRGRATRPSPSPD